MPPGAVHGGSTLCHAARFHVPSREVYIGLGVFYREDPSIREFHNAYHPQMADFLRDAMYEYALTKL